MRLSTDKNKEKKQQKRHKTTFAPIPIKMAKVMLTPLL